jgi:ankyrin repeat protein
MHIPRLIVILSLFILILVPVAIAMEKPKPDQKALNEELHEAIRAGNLQRVRGALQSGAQATGRHGTHSMIEEAVYADLYCSGDPTSNETAIVEELVRAGVDPNLPTHQGGEYPLEYAIRGKCPAVMVATLLRLGARPTVAARSNFTPLHSAARRNLPEVMILLLASGADRTRQYADQTPLDIAREEGYEVPTQILQHGPQELLRDTIQHGLQHAVRFMINSDNVNQPDAEGITPLGHAIQSNQLEIVQLLINELGANANQPFDRHPSVTPLEAARTLGHQAIVEFLRAQALQAAPAATPQQPLLPSRQATETQMMGRQQEPKRGGWLGWFWSSK